ncbi:H-2 class I histocompatibility antigen, alpha chain-like [Hippocampus zosterae]|uniref:H-2 class I histocompatibility antigen, alpha chain-like n=1 Tax=Hippocampus zosterae TaxID=109293 RepID=UPI00223CE692|nr:H-2 class I histocompatibility antigen, alpha chain-like [Hippocampus zosterae]
MIQRMEGCEWDDETGEVDGWDQFSYDGEDFISLEWKTMRWIAANPQAFITKNKWERLDGFKEYKKRYVTEICSADLKTYVSNGRDYLMRTELPTVSLLQKTPSSPVTCFATGFYPLTSDLFWRKDGEQLYEDVEMDQTLPNHDGTFQTAVHLKVEAAPDAEAKYECVFRLAGVEEAIVVKLDGKNILSNVRDAEEEQVKMVVAIAVTLGVLALLAAGVAAFPRFLAKRRRNRQARYSAAVLQSIGSFSNLFFVTHFTTLEELINLALVLDNRMRERERERGHVRFQPPLLPMSSSGRPDQSITLVPGLSPLRESLCSWEEDVWGQRRDGDGFVTRPVSTADNKDIESLTV